MRAGIYPLAAHTAAVQSGWPCASRDIPGAVVGKVLRAWLALCEQGYTPSHRMNLHLSNVGPVRAGIYHVDNSAPRQRLPCCPASTIFAGWRQSVLPVHLLGLAPLLGSVGPVAGDVKLQDDGVVHDPVNRRGGGHGVGEDALPLREDQV